MWQRVANPDARRSFELHRSVREKLVGSEREISALFGKPFAYENARIALEDAGVESSSDPMLLFDYGEVLEALDEHEKAIAVLQKALLLAPDHPAADDASLTLAFAFAKLDRSEEELEYYRRYLRGSNNVRARSTATLNMAEAEMRLGRLEDAVVGYRESYRLATEALAASSSQETAALACYGLGVALDRQGDTTGSRTEVQRALLIDPSMSLLLSSPNVFFVPAYERSYYLGLAFEARARDLTAAPAERHEHLRRALFAYKTYLDKARPDDRWVYRAREHRVELAAWGKTLPVAKPRAYPIREPLSF